jgi:NNP family nitrate/nitrite transporter-like MFS transporter
MTERRKAHTVLAMNTLAFTACFAVWMMNGVLITFLVDNRIYDFTKAEMGWLIGIPVLTGALFRLPVGVLTDKYGGRPVYAAVMVVSAAGAFAMSFADSFWGFVLGGLCFGLAGTSFAVGIAYSSVWYPKHQQGTALGIFGAGNAGAAITSMGAPVLLKIFTNGATNPDGWRMLPRVYAGGLLLMTLVFWMFTHAKKVEHSQEHSLLERLAPLKEMRVWRFGLYYFFVFGGFVALAQWLIPYYVNTYGVTVAMAGMLAAIYSLPSGVIRAFGGWLSDKLGARTVMYWVLGGSALCCFALIMPRMDMYAPGQGVMAARGGDVTEVTADHVTVDDRKYPVQVRQTDRVIDADDTALIMPTGEVWQEPVVKVGDKVSKRQLLAKGITRVYFQANIWVFTAIVFIIGILMGIGKAAVYKHIPEYFPKDVGVVGGIVGVLGGLGGFFSPILFGYMLRGTGIWTTAWMFFFALSMTCLIWMHLVIRKMLKQRVPKLSEQFEDDQPSPTAARHTDATATEALTT